jgi:hypothetical protein
MFEVSWYQARGADGSLRHDLDPAIGTGLEARPTF